MFPTIEVRWFYEGMVPLEASEWFQKCDQKPVQSGSRVDYYLCLADTDSLGIKLREGRLEIKQRHRQHGVFRLHERVSGLVEAWRKWSFKIVSSDSSLWGNSLPGPSWIGVKKERQLRRYRLTAERKALGISAEDLITQACSLELTQVCVQGQAWWSLGFEAFGDESSLQADLVLVAEHVLGVDEPPTLEARDSYSYPGWLEVMRRRGQVSKWEGENASHQH